MTKDGLLADGVAAMRLFCNMIDVKPPTVIVMQPGHKYYNTGSCAFYRNGTIWIAPKKCAHPGNGIRSWSWPGNTVDRTPYGVVQHELGHHMDLSTKGLFKGWKKLNEKPITGYHGTGDNWVSDEARREDFAECFRLFITNPGLLLMIRPQTYRFFRYDNGFELVAVRSWKKVLAKAPMGIRRAARNKVKAAKRNS